MLKWVVERLTDDAAAVDTPIGRVPAVDAIDRDGLDIDEAAMAKLLEVDAESWRGEVALVEGHYEFIGERLPQEMRDELEQLEKRLAE